MNISDLSSFESNLANEKITITIDQSFNIKCQTLNFTLSKEDSINFFEGLVRVESDIFYEPKSETYYKGIIKHDSKNNLTNLELFNITLLYTRYKKFKKEFEEYQYDFLTKLPIRAKLESDMLGYLSYAINSNDKFAIVMADIDLFKLFNDRYGHVFGDHVLTLTAETISHAIRNDDIRRKDIIGRYGGEEFLIVLKNVDITESLKIAERIRLDVAKMDLNGPSVTISLGIFHSDMFEREKCKQLMTKQALTLLRDQLVTYADTALYESKTNGRNRSTIYNKQNINEADSSQKGIQLKKELIVSNH